MPSEQAPPVKRWTDRWVSIFDETGGGQSEAKIVRPRADGDVARFLKILRHQSDALRRNRMYREVAAYRTLNHPAIPKVIDTNVEKYEDTSYKLYLVTEWIKGTTLERTIEENGVFSYEVAIQLVIRLLDIVEYCHANDTVHRDIKPDNVILNDGDPTAPFLIDFGLSFNKEDPPAIGTPSEEELGNRFCRLPELSASSRARRDPRSDVTFCAGILLYSITGFTPAVLIDENGTMPHQRQNIRQALRDTVPQEILSRLQLLFDRAFQNNLSLRWQSASTFNRELTLLMQPEADSEDYDALRERVHAHVDQPHVQAATRVQILVGNALQRITSIHDQIRDDEGGQFETNQTAYHRTSDYAETMLGLTTVANPRPLENWIRFRAEVVGNEMVVSASYKDSTSILLRTALDDVVFDSEFERRVRTIFYQQIADML